MSVGLRKWGHNLAGKKQVDEECMSVGLRRGGPNLGWEKLCG